MSRVRPERRGYAKLNYEQHLERLKNMKPTVECGPPREHPFSNKREQDKVFNHLLLCNDSLTHLLTYLLTYVLAS